MSHKERTTSQGNRATWLVLALGLVVGPGWCQQLAQHRHEPSFRVVARRPESSSSLFADIEDLADSSVRTRAGNLKPETSLAQAQAAEQPAFEQLIGRLLEMGRLLAAVEPPGAPPHSVAADPNNKTTMRFFRNSKTFGSIVFTNAPPRRLINCHLVDLERHSQDVALFEAKYGIRTMDVNFRDMMQIIDSCTNVARVLRPIRPPGAANSSLASSDAPPRPPVLVVGRPASLPASQPAGSSYSQLMSNALNRELQSLGPTVDDSNKLDLPGAGSRARSIATPPTNPFAPIQQLVVGEVTPAPASRSQASTRPGIREALHEITSYDSTDLMAIWRGILPGTNWCGMGDRATSYNDLGFEADIDICCRAHDFCPVRLGAFTSGYGLFNWSFYTRSHCSCDQNFLDCLERADSPVASVVMRLYFNVMKTTCLHDNETSSYALYGTTAKPSSGRPVQLPPAASGASRSMPDTAAQQAKHRARLLDQIRANLPIPALAQSKLLRQQAERARQRAPARAKSA